LLFVPASITVSRLAVHSIVLIFAIASSNGSLLCTSWCGPHETDTRTCGHNHPASRLIGSRNLTCDDASRSVVGFVREDMRRTWPDSDTRSVPISRSFNTLILLGAGVRHSPGRATLVDERPLDTNLRL